MKKYFLVLRFVILLVVFLSLTGSLLFAANWQPLPDTGQTKCYADDHKHNENLEYEISPCPAEGQDFYGQDAQYHSKSPSYSSQVINEEEVVIDNNTGLIWQQSTADTNGDGWLTSSDQLPYEDASVYCQNLSYAGRTNWRIPTIVELESIVDYGRYYPAINPIFEVQTSLYSSAEHWTSTVESRRADGSIQTRWYIGFTTGGVERSLLSSPFWVRCVSGGITEKFGPYINNNNNTITDQETGLTWMRHPADINNDGAINSSDQVIWKDALAWCEGATIAGSSDWRLPNIRELRSILDYSRHYPAIDPLFIEDGYCYWSSTTLLNQSTYPGYYAWVTDFYTGDDDVAGKLFSKLWDKRNIRCVRGGVSLPPPIAMPWIPTLLLNE
jgi:hypothetical protein